MNQCDLSLVIGYPIPRQVTYTVVCPPELREYNRPLRKTESKDGSDSVIRITIHINGY